MKKWSLIVLSAILLAGCSAKEDVKTFYLEEEEDGIKYTYTETYTAVKDELTHGQLVTTITIEQPEDGDLDDFKEFLDVQKACPYGVEDEEGNITVGCSKYITVDWKFDEAKNQFVTTEEIKFKEAANAKEDIYSEEADGDYSENEYYSLEKFESDLLSKGYSQVK